MFTMETPQANLTFHTEPTLNIQLSKSLKTFNGHYLIAENTSRTLLSQSVISVDKYLKKAYIPKYDHSTLCMIDYVQTIIL